MTDKNITLTYPRLKMWLAIYLLKEMSVKLFSHPGDYMNPGDYKNVQ